MKKYLLALSVVFALPVLAHQPFVIDSAEGETVTIESPTISYAFYGELNGEPQLYELSSDEPFLLYVQVLEPDIESAKNTHSAVIRKDGEVVAELRAADTTWERYFEFFGGDYYLNGPEYRNEQAEAGTYQIEVSSPDNSGKYVLVTGTVEDFSNTTFLATVSEIYQVKLFFEKSPLAILQTPFVYVPLGGIVLVGLIAWFFLKRRK